MDDFLNICAV